MLFNVVILGLLINLWGLPLITYASRGTGGGGVKPPIHFYCVLHAQRGGGKGVQIACKIARSLNLPLYIILTS